MSFQKQKYHGWCRIIGWIFIVVVTYIGPQISIGPHISIGSQFFRVAISCIGSECPISCVFTARQEIVKLKDRAEPKYEATGPKDLPSPSQLPKRITNRKSHIRKLKVRFGSVRFNPVRFVLINGHGGSQRLSAILWGILFEMENNRKS